jgi:hypothetical protein
VVWRFWLLNGSPVILVSCILGGLTYHPREIKTISRFFRTALESACTCQLLKVSLLLGLASTCHEGCYEFY